MRFVALISTLAATLALLPSPGQPAVSARIGELTLGLSGDGRPITALRVGDGPRKFVLAGDTHGGPEANTYQLATQLAEYYRTHPEQRSEEHTSELQSLRHLVC